MSEGVDRKPNIPNVFSLSHHLNFLAGSLQLTTVSVLTSPAVSPITIVACVLLTLNPLAMQPFDATNVYTTNWYIGASAHARHMKHDI